MSTDGRKVFVLVAAMVAILALAAVTTFAAVTNFSSATHNNEAQSGDEMHEADVVKLGKATKNKGKSDPGMCVYSATNNKYTFKNVPKGNVDANDPIIKEIDKGGEFADSQSDCDKLNANHAKPPKDSEDEPATGTSPEADRPGPKVDPPSAALEANKIGTARSR